jgi:uncharacterized RDD family membrane protein YckC
MVAASQSPRAAVAASISRRLLALVYELLLLAAVLVLGALPAVFILPLEDPGWKRPLLQLYLAALAGAYFVYQWCRGGRTLAMKTWRLRLVTREGAPLDARRAWIRYAWALAGFLAAGIGFAWALVDRDRLFLHDRLAGTRIIRDDAPEKP